jgi:hypothetical protein
MSTSNIGSTSTVPGFNVLFPGGLPGASAPGTSSSSSSASATPPTTAPTSSTSTAPATAAASSSSSSSAPNVYQQAYDGIQSWQISYLYETLNGGNSTLPEFAGGGTVDQFAQLATELGAINASASTGSTVDTSA